MQDFLRKGGYGETFGGDFAGTSAAGLGDMDNAYDTDMSGGHISSGPITDHSSSNTSYSPHSQNADMGTTIPKPAVFQPANPIAGTAKFFNFTNADGNFVPAMPSQQRQINSDFDLSPSAWNFDTNAASPSNFTTGLTPAADGEWSNILENMNWDSTMLDTNAAQWNTSSGGTS